MTTYAIIDLGTNTFHLLIVQIANNTFHKLYQERIHVKLGEEGIEEIGDVPFQRGLLAMRHFSEAIAQLNVEKENIRAIGTAALRKASNSEAFLAKVKEATEIEVQVIDGDLEAALIHRGVCQAVPLSTTERVVIMDVGGGSVEFIITDHEKIYWAKSFEVGVSVLWKRFHHSNPMTEVEQKALLTFLDEELATVKTALKEFDVTRLIGASGTFDVMAGYLPILQKSEYYTINDLTPFQEYKNEVVNSTEAQLYQIPSIPRERVKFIVVAFLMIDWLLQKMDISELTASDFAMKEGILSTLVKN